MTSIEALLPDDPVALAALMDAAAAKFAAAQFASVTEDGLVNTAEVMESARRRLDGADAALLVEISDRNLARKVGLFSLHQFLAQYLRVGDGEAKRRRVAAEAIGQFSSLSGGTLDPRLPATAGAVADGVIGGGHIREIAAVMDRIPAAVDADIAADWQELQLSRVETFRQLLAKLPATALRPGLTKEAAIDTAWAIASPETHELFVVRRGWSYDEYEAWVASTLTAALLSPDGT